MEGLLTSLLSIASASFYISLVKFRWHLVPSEHVCEGYSSHFISTMSIGACVTF